MRRIRLAPLAAALVVMLVAVLAIACTDTSGTQTAPRRLAPGSLGIVSNWRAVKLPIHVRVDNTELRIWTAPKDSLSDSSASGHGVCQVSELRATAVDDNGRQIDDNLIAWQSLDTTVARVDAQGFVTPATSCRYDAQGHLVLLNQRVGIVATLKAAK